MNEKEPNSKISPLLNVLTLSNDQIQNADIKIAKAEKRIVSGIIKANGKIDVPPQNLVSVSVAISGYLKSTQLLPGMHLKKGEIIATLEDQQYIEIQQEYLTTKYELKALELDYERQKELNKSKASSDKNLEKSIADYQAKKIKLSSLAEKLRLININPDKLTDQLISRTIAIYAPFDGYVSKVNVNVGKYINTGEVMFELVNPSDIHLNLKMFEKDLFNLEIGQKLTAYTNFKPDIKFNCEIILISQDIAEDGTAEVHCHFENYNKMLLPGTYMNADIKLNNKEVFALPEDAIVNYEGKYYVFLVKGKNDFELKEVEIGESEDSYTEIINGDDLNECKIVSKNAFILLTALKNKAEE
jgi:cobalt-zinc-cadmium efflux system membrane fusion protein